VDKTQGVQGSVTTDSEFVQLSIPARPELLSLPRMTAAAIASQGGFDVEDVEDVRLAIEELCLAAFEGRGPGRLYLHLGFRGSTLEVECTFEPEGDSAATPEPRGELATQLTEQLLSALTDSHGIDVVAGRPRAWFHKQHHDPPTE
jgi:hypothetical protein